MRFSVATVLVIIVLYGFLLAVLLFVLNHYLDMRVISYTVDITRQATNFLHFILSEVVLPSKEKLVVDSTLYNVLNYLEVPEYDFEFNVTSLDGDNIISFTKNFVFNMDSRCYLQYQRMTGYAEMPVAIAKNNKFIPGKAKLTLMRTPISELAFWLSQSSQRLKEGSEIQILKTINLGEEVTGITINSTENEVCMKTGVGNIACKKFLVDGQTMQDKQFILEQKCKKITITATKTNIDVEVSFY